MPPLAISNRPFRSARASVNAPRTWPNISLSNSVAGTPPRLTFTKGLAGAAAVAVDRLGDQLLAGAALAGDEHRGVGRRDAADQLQDAQHARVAADQVAEVVARVELVAGQRPVVRLRPARNQPERRLHRLQHLLVRPRLGDEVRGPRLHPFDRQRNRAPRRDQNHRNRRRGLLDLPQQRQPLLARRAPREVHVLDDQLTGLPAQHVERFVRRPAPIDGRPACFSSSASDAVTERSSSTIEDHVGQVHGEARRFVRGRRARPPQSSRRACGGLRHS